MRAGAAAALAFSSGVCNQSTYMYLALVQAIPTRFYWTDPDVDPESFHASLKV